MVSSKNKYTSVLIQLRVPYSGPEPPHEAFANLSGDRQEMEAFAKRFGIVKHPSPHPGLVAVFGPPRDITYKRVEHLRKAWQGDADALQKLRHQIEVLTTFRFKIEGKRIELEPRDVWSKICFLFLCDQAAGKTAICANPDCHSPYFIKRRKTQKYCTSGPCTEQAQREQKRLWWERNYGKETK